MAISKDLIAASATPLILSILEESENYGYAIIKQVKELSGNELHWTDGMLYPVLHRLERQDLVESYWQTSSTGRKRKYYRIKETGQAELVEQRRQWEIVDATLRKLWTAEKSIESALGLAHSCR
jgi:PadR family transcriptional regulator